MARPLVFCPRQCEQNYVQIVCNSEKGAACLPFTLFPALVGEEVD